MAAVYQKKAKKEQEHPVSLADGTGLPGLENRGIAGPKLFMFSSVKIYLDSQLLCP
jgi:hypothetical protein